MNISLLVKLDDLLTSYSSVRSLPKPRHKDVHSISTWFSNHPGAISPPETEYITHTGDLVPLVPKAVSPLRRLLEKSTKFRLLRFFLKRSYDSGTVHYTSEAKINNFVDGIMVVVGLGLLIAPLWILAFVTEPVQRLAIITAFVVVFLPIVTFASLARPSEALAATAGSVWFFYDSLHLEVYCANPFLRQVCRCACSVFADWVGIKIGLRELASTSAI